MAHSDFDTPTTHHEESDVSLRGILGFAIALTIVIIVMCTAVYLLLRFYERGAETAAGRYTIPRVQELPPTPQLQTNPRRDLRDLRAEEDTILNTYGWADQNAGVVRIPIAQAMKLTLQRGLPARNAPEPPAATSSGDANSGRIVGALEAKK